MRIKLYFPRVIGPTIRPSLCSCAETIGKKHAQQGELVFVDGVSADRPEDDTAAIICETDYWRVNTHQGSYIFPRQLAESLSGIANRHVLVIDPQGSLRADSKNLFDLSVQKAG
ncbi:MAG: hypothetical protein AAB921_01940 [Patescibacteria group bacterium]